MAEKLLVTCALPYVNNVPHLGNMIPILSADTYTRFLKMTGREAIYICATDEHGTRTEIEAKRAGLSPEKWCDRMHAAILENFTWFNVKFDYFGKTSSPSNHRITRDIYRHLEKNGYILEEEIEQLYCSTCRQFLPDTYVHGTCPICHTPDASGDQCDACGHFLDPFSLLHPRCKICGSEPKSRTSRHLFLDLPKLAPKIKSWVGEQAHWDGIIKSIPLGWIKEGLKPRCITRDLSWGVKVPKKGFESKVFYVWFDAPIGYIAATADLFEENEEKWKSWWKNPESRVIHFLGKDNVPFHTLMWPASLIGADDDWNLPHYIAANHYLNYEGGQFSKSRNRGIFSSDVKDLPFAPDVWRFSLMANRPEKKDVDFSWQSFFHTINADLVGNLGNLAYRTLTFLKKRFKTIPPESTNSEDVRALKKADAFVEKIRSLYASYRFREAAATLLEFGDHGNLFFHENEPWKTIKENPDRCSEVMHTSARILAQITWCMAPLMPDAATQIRTQLGIDTSNAVWEVDPQISGFEIQKPEPVFAKTEESVVEELHERFKGKQEEQDYPPISYTIDPSIDYFSYVVEFSGLTVKKRNSSLEQEKRSMLSELDLETHKQNECVQAYLPLLEERDKGGRTVSVLNLIDIVERNGKLPTINTLVDAYNLKSLQHAVVMGAYDRRALKGNLRMKVADGSEHFVPVTGKEPEKILPGEWVITDEEDRVVTKILTKQSEAVAVTTDTTHAALCIQGNPAISKTRLREVTEETCRLIEEICGGTWRIVNE